VSFLTAWVDFPRKKENKNLLFSKNGCTGTNSDQGKRRTQWKLGAIIWRLYENKISNIC
jgi:hypothetical protein